MALAKKDEQTTLVPGEEKEPKPIVEDEGLKIVGEKGPEKGPKNPSSQDDPTNDPTVVKMTRETPMHKGGPTTADVHPDEVDAWIKAGWAKA